MQINKMIHFKAFSIGCLIYAFYLTEKGGVLEFKEEILVNISFAIIVLVVDVFKSLKADRLKSIPPLANHSTRSAKVKMDSK